jgi:hypothetical protein
MRPSRSEVIAKLTGLAMLGVGVGATLLLLAVQVGLIK